MPTNQPPLSNEHIDQEAIEYLIAQGELLPGGPGGPCSPTPVPDIGTGYIWTALDYESYIIMQPAISAEDPSRHLTWAEVQALRDLTAYPCSLTPNQSVSSPSGAPSARNIVTVANPASAHSGWTWITERSTAGSSGPWTQVDQRAVSGPSVNQSWADFDVVAGNQYWYRSRWTYNNVASNWSAVDTVVTQPGGP